MYEFKTEVDFQYIGSNIINPYGGKCKVKWTLDIEMREWGIKSFIISVPDQVIICDVSCYDSETYGRYRDEIEIEFKDVEVRCDCDVFNHNLVPSRLELWKDKAILEFV